MLCFKGRERERESERDEELRIERRRV